MPDPSPGALAGTAPSAAGPVRRGTALAAPARRADTPPGQPRRGPAPGRPTTGHGPRRAGHRKAGPRRAGPAGPSTAVTAGTVLATVVDTPIGPLSLLTHGGQLVAGGFAAQPAVMHAGLAPPLRALTLEPADPADLPWLAKPVAALFRR